MFKWEWRKVYLFACCTGLGSALSAQVARRQLEGGGEYRAEVVGERNFLKRGVV